MQIDSSPESICMKCQIMFYGKNIISLSFAEFVQRATKVNYLHVDHDTAPVLLIANNKLRRSALQPTMP